MIGPHNCASAAFIAASSRGVELQGKTPSTLNFSLIAGSLSIAAMSASILNRDSPEFFSKTEFRVQFQYFRATMPITDGHLELIHTRL
jgi:hypothetical protein